MADLNSTLVRGNLRVTDEITTGSVTSPKVILNDVQHRLSQEDGTTITRYNGATIAVPNISGKGAALLTDEGNDFGLLYIGSDGALLANSGDTGYVLRVHDKDTSTDILQVCQTSGTSAFNSNLNVNGTLEATSITESGTALSSKYLGINSNAVSSSIPYGFSSRGTNDWSGVSGTMITDWSTSSSGDIMFKDDSGKINVITDGRFYQGIDIYGSSQRVLDEYDISHTTWGTASSANYIVEHNFSSEDSAMPSEGARAGIFYGTTSSVGSDGALIGFNWTDATHYGAQLFIDCDPTYHIALRQRDSSGNWNAWVPIITGNNIGSQSVNYANSAGSATDSTKVPLAGNSSSMTGTLRVLGSDSVLGGNLATSITTNTSGCPNIYISPDTNGHVYIHNLMLGIPGATGNAIITKEASLSDQTYTLPATGGTLATTSDIAHVWKHKVIFDVGYSYYAQLVYYSESSTPIATATSSDFVNNILPYSIAVITNSSSTDRRFIVFMGIQGTGKGRYIPYMFCNNGTSGIEYYASTLGIGNPGSVTIISDTTTKA